MESCLLCLEINKDILDCIKSDSGEWTKLNIEKIIEKHFWSLNNIQFNSWICLSCWREVEGFHKFYLRIEEAHSNFGKIKMENLAETVECKEELPMHKINNEYIDTKNEDTEFCFLEPEILIDQTQQENLTQLEIIQNSKNTLNMNVEKTTTTCESSDESDDIPLKRVCKQPRVKINLECNDPLEKPSKIRKKRKCKTKLSAEEESVENDMKESQVKKQSSEIVDNNDSDEVNDDDIITDKTYKLEEDKPKTSDSKKGKSYSKHLVVRKENDKFIAEHFKQMFCDLCQEPFEDFHAMQRHYTENHKQCGYVVCCKRKFFGRSRLVDHLHSHLNPDHFKCKECGKALSDRLSFNNHMLRVHRANEVVKRHACDLCGKSFIKAYVLRKHKLTHLSEDEKKFHCDDCGKNYGSPYLLHLHKQTVHLKRFAKICYICGKAINSSAEFKIHMSKHEGIPLPEVNCDICGLRLTSERGLKLHKESQHPIGGKQEQQCPICPKISPNIKALKKHIYTMHEKGYDHKCSICEKAFKRSEALRDHMATHTGTSLYTCPWCPKTFNSNGNMHAHRKKIHPKEWEESKLQKYSDNIKAKI